MVAMEMHMRSPVALLFVAVFSLPAQNSSKPDWQTWLSQGVAAFKEARYQEAIDAFQRAAELNPNQATVHAYLGNAYLSQYIPGSQSPENVAHARDAEAEFRRTLDLNALNATALQSLASLSYMQASSSADAPEKIRKFAEAQDWHRRLLTVDPRNKEAYYSLGVIAWAQWYPNLMTARAQLGMKPQDAGPLPNPAYRQELKNKYSQMVEDGIANLQKALEIDADHADAMAYMNLVDGVLQGERLIHKVGAVCSSAAIQARISGTVIFTVMVGRDGRVANAQLISGHPLLVPAAWMRCGNGSIGPPGLTVSRLKSSHEPT